jgi:hypothetical protein
MRPQGGDDEYRLSAHNPEQAPPEQVLGISFTMEQVYRIIEDRPWFATDFFAAGKLGSVLFCTVLR